MRSLLPLPAALTLLAACTPDGGLTKFNSEPAAAITSPADGDEVRDGTSLALRGSASDANHAAAELTARWFMDDVEACAGTPAADGTTTCDVTVPEADTLTVRLEVTDPEGAAASDSITLTVTPDATPTATIASPTADGVYYSDQLVTLRATVDDAEDAADTLTVRWESSRDGDLGSPTPSSEGLVESFVSLSEGQHALQVFVTDGGGNEGQASVIVDVGPPNSAPGCAITAPADGSAGEVGTTVTFRGTTSDPDIPADRLAVTWSSDKDGTLGTSTPGSDGSVAFSFDGLSVDTHVVSMQVADELGATCTAQVVYAVGSAPTIELESPADGEVVAEGEALVFTALVADGEDAPGDLLVRWESSVDGLLYEGPPDSAGVAQFVESALSPGDHVLTVTVTDTDGLYTSALGTFTVDGAPSAPGVSIAPASPVTDDDLVVSVDTPAVDPEGGSLTYLYTWSVDGVPSGASASATLPASATRRGEAWSVAVTATDGVSTSAAGTASVTIGNSDPVATVSLAPASPTRADTLTCAATATDADGDALAYTFAWTVDGAAVSAGSTSGATSTLAGAFVAGDVVTCEVTASDGTTSASTSASVTIGNTAPTASVTLSPSTVYTDDTLTATVTSADADGDTLSVSYAWTVDGMAATSTSATLTGADFDRDEVVEVTVTVSDGADTTTASASVTVSNTPPTAPSARIDPEDPRATDDLLCSVATAATDADGDTVSYTVAWTVDGAAFGGAATTTLTGDTIAAADTAGGDLWTCTLTPTDGTDGGPAGTASVTVGAEFTGWPSRSVGLASADHKLRGEVADDRAGYTTGVGDVDGDGLADFATAARGNDTGGSAAGQTYVVTGAQLAASAPTSFGNATYRFVGDAAEDYLNVSTGPLGDVDGDGLSDLLFNALRNDDAGTNRGAVYLVLGAGLAAGEYDVDAAADVTWYGEAADDFGEHGYTGADIDGDGLDDVILNASGNDAGGSGAGKAYLFFAAGGLAGGSVATADYTFVGENAGDAAGFCSADAGDVDGDGTDDLLIVAIGADDGGSGAGKVHLLLGGGLTGSGTVDLSAADYALVGENAGDGVGYVVAGLPDTDGDGLSDVFVSGNANDRGGTESGAAYVVLGSSFGSTPTIDLSAADYILVGENAGDYAGIVVSSGGDVDADGLTDLWLGAQGHNGVGADSGAAYLVLAASLGSPGVLDLSLADYMFTGESTSDYAGTSVAGPGDIDGDGLDDLVVSAHMDDDGATNAGATYVLLAP